MDSIHENAPHQRTIEKDKNITFNQTNLKDRDGPVKNIWHKSTFNRCIRSKVQINIFTHASSKNIKKDNIVINKGRTMKNKRTKKFNH